LRTVSASAHGPNSSQPGCPTIPWRSARTLQPPTSTVLIWKNLMSGIGLHDLRRVRALHLITVRLPLALVHERALVALELRVVAAGRYVVLHPVQRGRAADQIETVRR